MSSNFEQLCQTIARLRAPDGCPWDREQTHKSLTRFLLEETYEVLEAINSDDDQKLKEELGDLLLQIVLQAQLASEDKHFDIEDVAAGINQKMITRHPHVFSDSQAKNSEEVLAQWEELKAAEKKHEIRSALSGIPDGLPALLKALKISEKAVNQGFEWEKEEDIWAQLDSELEELQEVITKAKNINTKSSVADEDLYLEMGDVLFTMVNIARWHKIDPEQALLMTIEKFKKRFQLIENNSSRPLKELSTTELNQLWNQAKIQIAQETK